MRHLFTISGRYAATDDAPIPTQVGYKNLTKEEIYVHARHRPSSSSSSSRFNVCVLILT